MKSNQYRLDLFGGFHDGEKRFYAREDTARKAGKAYARSGHVVFLLKLFRTDSSGKDWYDVVGELRAAE